jgi:hypothetical protein
MKNEVCSMPHRWMWSKAAERLGQAILTYERQAMFRADMYYILEISRLQIDAPMSRYGNLAE